MRTSRLARRGLIVLIASVLALFVAPQPARAATGYALVAGGARTTTSSTAIKLTVAFTRDDRPVRKATARLQYLKAGKWVTEKKVAIRSGKGSVKVKHGVGDRTYRFSVAGKATSAPFTVHFIPATFTIAGSGWGHGVGMAQWGAWQLAREGAPVATILGYYYPGAEIATVVNNPRTIKVQVLGPPKDSRKTTRLSISSGGFTITDGTSVLASTASRKPVTVAVSGTDATAKVTLPNGKTRTLHAARLVFGWGSKATVTVAGAHGSYRYGTLQATVIGARPNLVNELKMNTEYLYGVDEMPSSWGSAAGKGLAALEAQAIAARSYVIRQALRWKTTADPLGANPACDCHVYDDSRSQNFTGWRKAGGAANKPWRQAVDNTVHDTTVDILRPTGVAGAIAETVYFASSGSYTVDNVVWSGTISNADAWGTAPVSYLTHVADPYSARAPGNPHRSWTRALTQAKLSALFGVGALRSVKVSERYPGGQVKSLTATTVDGATVSLSDTSEHWRTRLGLPGAWVAGIRGR